MNSFVGLASSRRQWIHETLLPWCRQASYRDLLEAEQDWGNIAGQVDPEITLWAWAWGRFPELIHDGMPGLNETSEVRLCLSDGQTVVGYPDRQASSRGEIVLVSRTETGFETLGPFRIDEIESANLTNPQSGRVNEPPQRPTTLLPPETPPDARV